MLTILFIIFILGFLFKGIGLALRLSWGIMKILFTVVLLPAFLIGLFVVGLVHLAFPLLIIAGLVLVVNSIAEAH